LTVVVKENPKTILSVDKATAPTCQQVTFTATVGGGEVNPTGTVTFTVDGKKAGTATLVQGKATWVTKGLTEGTRKVVVKYSGDGGFAANQSAPLTERITHDPSCVVHSTPATPHSSSPPAVHGGASKPSGGGSLASTGAKVATLLGGAVLLLAAGGALLLSGRRRRTSRHGL
jgi:hypothetical protein